MMRTIFILLFIFISAGLDMLAGNDMVLYNANVVDIENGRVLSNHTISVKNGKIISVRPARGSMRKGEYDMTGKYVMPGLIDSHVHYANACRTADAAREISGEFLKSGVTTVRDVGGNYLFIKDYNRLRDSGKLTGPDIYYSSLWAAEPFMMPSVLTSGADSENTPWCKMFSIKDSTDVAIEKAVREAKEIGCTGFKLYINYSADDLARLVPVARKYGMKVWGHSSQVVGADAMQVASSGMEVMSHAYLLPRNFYPAERMSDSDREYVSGVLDEMLRRGVFLDMTVRLSHDSGTRFASEVAKMAYEKGVKFVVGTDLPGCRIHDEMEILSKECGISNRDLLLAATSAGAEILGKQGSLGVIAEGAEADFVVLDANPLEDLACLRNVSMTIGDGRVVYRSSFASDPIVLYNCNIVDTEAGKIRRGQTLLLEDGIIKSISRAAEYPLGHEIDMTGKYVMPGMIDSHVHWSIFAQTDMQAEIYSKEFLSAGVTTVRDMGSNYLIIKNFTDKVRSGEFLGPRVFYSALWATGSYFLDPMDSVGWEGESDPVWSRKLDISRCTDDQLEKAVLEAKNIGCSGIKLYINYSLEDLSRAVSVMRRHGMKAWAHATQVNGADALQVAGSGADVVSHAYMLCNDINSRDTLTSAERDYLAKVCRVLRRKGVILDATAHISMYEGQMQYSRQIIQQAYESGVKIAAGTDFFGNAIYEEIKHLKSCGMSNEDILRSLTTVGAEILDMSGRLGTIRKGAMADLLVLDGNPLEDISVLDSPESVFAGGKLVSFRQ